MIHIETRIQQPHSRRDAREHITIITSPRIVLPDELAERLSRSWKSKVVADVTCQTTLISSTVKVGNESVVEAEHSIPVGGIFGQEHIHLQVAVADDCGVHVDACEVVVGDVS